MESVASSFRNFIMTRFPAARRRAFNNDDSLLESGIIDSLGVLDLVTFIEDEFKISVVDDDLTPDNFQTIDRMTAFVGRKRKADAQAV